MPSDQAIVARIDSVLKKTSRDPAYGSNDYAEDISEQISTMIHTVQSLVAPRTSVHEQLPAITDPRP
jgi:hypothetical protein